MAKKQVKKKEPKLIKLDIACGQTKPEGWVGVDIVKCKGVDIAHDLNTYPWPFKDNSVEEARCSHYIEHIPMEYLKHNGKRKDAMCAFFDELYRILIPGGKAQLMGPYYTSERCWQDPTHRRPITNALFYYLSQDWLKANKLDHYNIECNFEAQWGYDIEPDWAVKSDEAKAPAIRHYWNVVRDIHIMLTKR